MSLLDKLGPLTLDAPDGESVQLSRLWEDHTVVLVFLRHFG